MLSNLFCSILADIALEINPDAEIDVDDTDGFFLVQICINGRIVCWIHVFPDELSSLRRGQYRSTKEQLDESIYAVSVFNNIEPERMIEVKNSECNWKEELRQDLLLFL